MKTIALLEDQKLLLDSLHKALEEDFQIVNSSQDISDTLDFLKRFDVDMLISDIMLGETNVLDYVKQIKELAPNIKIVLLTAFPEITFIKRSKQLGVNSFAYKNLEIPALKALVYKTFEGECIYPSNKLDETQLLLKNLNQKELTVLKLYCEGHTKPEIADIMAYSESSIKQAYRSILDKTNFESMVKLALYVVKNGYILSD